MPGIRRKIEIARGNIAPGGNSEPFDTSSFDGIYVTAADVLTLEASLDGGTTWRKVEHTFGFTYDTGAAPGTVEVMPNVPTLCRLNNGGAGALDYIVEAYRVVSGSGAM